MKAKKWHLLSREAAGLCNWVNLLRLGRKMRTRRQNMAEIVFRRGGGVSEKYSALYLNKTVSILMEFTIFVLK